MATKSKKMCRGCYNDFYNHSRDGGCWSFEKASVVKKVQVGIWEPPPYHPNRAQACLSCFNPQGYAMLETSDCRVRSTPFPQEN